jgi:glycosyltransferase involved in cell wall biosynthesis
VEPGVGWLGRVGDDELAPLYRGARCLVYPSLYEGFGIPVAEALACGTPVVTSRDSAMAEIAQGKAVLVDPEDVGSIAAGIAEAMERPVEGFRPTSWDEAAAGTLAVYREAAA